jgi:hypothetical protein
MGESILPQIHITPVSTPFWILVKKEMWYLIFHTVKVVRGYEPGT